MSFRPTLALLSKASRLPLSSKKGNKDFYKGAPCRTTASSLACL
jgi:hypothetical protein